MKRSVANLIFLFSVFVLPMPAQESTRPSTNAALATTQVINATLQVNGPNGATDGHNAPIALLVRGGQGGTGGVVNANGGNGGGIRLRAGDGGSSSQDAGSGGDIKLIAGAGGTSSEVGGSGGSITLQPGIHQCGVPGLCGLDGNVILDVPKHGFVGIGTTIPSNMLEVAVGGTTLADAWTTRSSRRFKTNIQPLDGALDKVQKLQGVSYERRDSGKREIGVVAEDVARIVPEVVSRDPQTREIQGVDYSRLAALLIEAIKSQEAEIRQLRQQIEQLNSKKSGQ